MASNSDLAKPADWTLPQRILTAKGIAHSPGTRRCSVWVSGIPKPRRPAAAGDE